MAKHERNRFVSAYHSIVAILLLIAGGAALGFGIWLQVTGNGGVFDLDYEGSNFLNLILRVPVIFMVVGGFLILTGVFSLIAMGRKCVGVTFRIFYVVMAAIIAAVLVFVCVFSILVRVNGGDENVKQFLSDAWNSTANDNPEQICDIQSHFECHGFNNGDCEVCPTGTEPECAARPSCVKCSSAADPSIGCYDKIIDELTQYALPSAIASGVLAAIVLVDILITCCL